MKTPDYKYVVVETYPNIGEPSSRRVRARPVRGQDPFLPEMKVRCSVEMREEDREGSKFIIKCQLTSCQGGRPFVSTSAHWPWYPVTDSDAARFIRGEIVFVDGVSLTRRS